MALPLEVRQVIEDAASVPELNGIYQTYHAGAGDQLPHLIAALDARKAELTADAATGPSEQQVVTSVRMLAQIDDDSLQATQDYAKALDAYAHAHTEFKTLRAKTYLRIKAAPVVDGLKPLTNGEAEMQADADDAVASARLQEYITEGRVKAARANLDRLERSFQYHRSLMVREDKVDRR